MNWRFFKLSEFECRCGCGTNEIDHELVDELDDLRYYFGKPLIVSSGYRCPEYNAQVSNTGLTGPHTTGRAVDFAISGKDALDLLILAGEMEFTGFGVNQKGAGRFIHLDTLPNGPGQPRPWIWTY